MRLPVSAFRDPGQLIIDLAARQPLRDGDQLLVLVAELSGRQEIEAVTRVRTEEWCDVDQFDRSILLHDKVGTLPVPPWDRRAPGHSIMTVVARPGFTILGPAEGGLADGMAIQQPPGARVLR